MADEWERLAKELKEATERSSADLAQAADAQNVRRLVRGFTKSMRGQSRADIAAALIATVAEFIQRSGSKTPGEQLTIMNTLFQEIISAVGRKPN